ncbi:hypothetical protein I350_00522 [Cryptococcus amylolentus CBS 6273]|uniref:Uncharacterized protein n=1 Tax=Cryptococcus amylolentus CBS 6273 TaxID=1296118 RepID=A0A1E3KF74_9TREE|nr:hypothetical protein I350_00522 [Cryptococcus amylolentus CBS 6273]
MLATESVRPAYRPADGSSSSSRGASGAHGSNWDEQIVPTLRNRLESESAYLTKRLSSTHFDDAAAAGLGMGNVNYESSSNRHYQPQPHPQSRPKQYPSASGAIPRSSRHPPASAETYAPAPFGSQAHQRGSPQGSPLVPSQRAGSPATTSASRIPTRPRSKSQLSSRPSLNRGDTSPVPRMPSPSGIPVAAKSRSRSPQPRDPRDGGGLSRGHSSRLPDIGRERRPSGRGSPNFDGGRVTEGFIKNELPPFKVQAEDALRIAQRGHDIPEMEQWKESWHSREAEDVEEPCHGFSEDGHGGYAEPRKRVVTMKGQGGYGNSNGLGIGQPSNRGQAGTPKYRVGSSRPANISTPNNQFAGPRSASMNIHSGSSSHTPNSAQTLPSSKSRLGLAAHMIPPESSYTPPKNANWDEVVLPTVAKKMGMGDEKASPNPDELGEEDYAVEWDRDGNPIRWAKRKIARKRALTEQAENMSTSTKPMFVPTFEASPDNPFMPPSTNFAQHSDSIELGALRGSQRHVEQPSPSKAGFQSQPGPTRKQSLLRKVSSQHMSHSASQRSLRTQNQAGRNDTLGGPSQWGAPQAPPPTPGTTNRITDAIYEKHLGSKERFNNAQVERNNKIGGDVSGAPSVPSKDDGKHGKGCGCVVM